MIATAFFDYARPMDWLLKPLAPLRLAGIVAFALLFFGLFSKKPFLRQRMYACCVIFVFVCAASVLYAPNTRAAFGSTMDVFLVTFGFVIPAGIVLCTKERLFNFIKYWMYLQTGLAIYVIAHGGHGPGSFLWDENDVGLALVMALPYPVFLLNRRGLSTLSKLGLLLAILINISAVGVTASRGAIVGLAAVIMVMTVLSAKPVRNAILVAAASMFMIVILLKLLPSAYVEDVENITNPEDSTRDERLWSWSIGWVMFKENPVLGLGAGNYPWTNHLYAKKSPMYTPNRKILGGRQAHSLYFSLLPDLGAVGSAIYFLIVGAVVYRCKRVCGFLKKFASKDDEDGSFELLFKAFLASLFAFLAAGAFVSVLYYPVFWHLVALVGAAYNVAWRELRGFGEWAA